MAGWPVATCAFVRRSTAAVLLAMVLMGVGCQVPPAAPGSAAPSRLSLTLRGATQDRRYTYFEMGDDGALSFGGGRAGALASATPVSTLTHEQRQEVWNIITGYRLLEAPSFPFDKSEKSAFDVKIKVGSYAHQFRAVDDKIPGVQELHDLLFKYQAAVRYKIPGLGGEN